MKLILVGKAAAGKDFLKNRLVAKNFKPGISCTTRLPRHNEVDGVDYHFMTEDQFKETIDSGEMLEHMIFNNWYYGLTKEEFEKADVMIMSKDGLDVLPKDYRDRCMVIYLDPPRITRVERLEHRNDPNDSIVRRMNTDDKQFEDFRDYDLKVRNEDF
jgi:guanylate kinase